MAFTVEDGTGLAGANSYATVAEADTYIADRGADATWAAALQAAKEGALVKATEYLEEKCIFLGDKKTSAQALSWPRSGAFDRAQGLEISDSEVPLPLKKATILLALLVVSAGENLTPSLARGGGIASESVGPISVSYFQNADPDTLYPAMRLIKGLVRPDDPAYGASIQSVESENTTDRYFTEGMFNNTSEE